MTRLDPVGHKYRHRGSHFVFVCDIARLIVQQTGIGTEPIRRRKTSISVKNVKRLTRLGEL
ncbi:hypothetical protein [Pseudonocardia sp. ICBG601]|uniref:hypothetical protein n=1 Tax=Pseudonocardia sp. ICBG601 TaxID=2846759 RepID=UPI001CF6B27D|nr:hypothetical protein [Pseudonocardia sp. ICBG601]